MKEFTMLYRLFTENKNKDKICRIVSGYFEGFTVFEAIGYWQGKQEKSLCIEIVANWSGDSIAEVCKGICQLNAQKCVLVQTLKNLLMVGCRD